MVAYAAISAFIGGLAVIPIIIHYLTLWGHFDGRADYSQWALWFWVAFGLSFFLAFVRSTLARLFILSIFISYALNLASIADIIRREYFATAFFFLGIAAIQAWKPRLYIYPVVIGAIANVGMGIAQKFGYWWFMVKNSDFSGVVGFLFNTNYFGAFMAVSAPLFLMLPGWLKALWILPAIGVWLSESTMAMAAFAVSSLYMASKLYSGKAIIAFILALGLFAAVFIIVNDKPSVSHLFRARVWRATVIDSFKPPIQKVIFGRGFGSYFIKFNKDHQDLADGQGRFWASSHNQYLDVLFEQGLFGLTLVLGYILVLGRRIKRVRGQAVFYGAAMLALMVSALGFFPLRVPMIAATAAVVVANIED